MASETHAPQKDLRGETAFHRLVGLGNLYFFSPPVNHLVRLYVTHIILRVKSFINLHMHTNTWPVAVEYTGELMFCQL